MIYLEIGANEEGQRLDRFLKKYLPGATLSTIYKAIRKDIKVNGKRKQQGYFLKEGDKLTFYILQEEFDKYVKKEVRKRSKKQFSIVFEDDNILVVDKPYGLLTHGSSGEKKDHLANQVVDYLIESGSYIPRKEKTFTPAPANRLDRNTTGLVIFGKNAESLRELNKLIRNRDSVKKTYLTIAEGEISGPLNIKSSLVKNSESNKVYVAKDKGRVGIKNSYLQDEPIKNAKIAVTTAYPIEVKNGYSLLEVEIYTGRTHQIRSQLSEAGHPLVGDRKYGGHSYGDISTQLLHAWKLEFSATEGMLTYLKNKKFVANPPERFMRIKEEIFK